MLLSWKEKTVIALIVIVGGLFLSYFSNPHLVSTLPGIEGDWDCPPNATTSSTVCIKRAQPK